MAVDTVAFWCVDLVLTSRDSEQRLQATYHLAHKKPWYYDALVLRCLGTVIHWYCGAKSSAGIQN